MSKSPSGYVPRKSTLQPEVVGKLTKERVERLAPLAGAVLPEVVSGVVRDAVDELVAPRDVPQHREAPGVVQWGRGPGRVEPSEERLDDVERVPGVDERGVVRVGGPGAAEDDRHEVVQPEARHLPGEQERQREHRRVGQAVRQVGRAAPVSPGDGPEHREVPPDVVAERE